jgi:hypothetical protein
MPSNGDLDARLARLEREGRVWRAAAVLSMFFAAVAWVVPSVSAQSQIITVDTVFARQIVVRPNPSAAGGAFDQPPGGRTSSGKSTRDRLW